MKEAMIRSECPSCGNGGYERLGQHWRYSDECDYPTPNSRQIEILNGLIMGDGSVEKSGENPSIETQSITKPFLEWLYDELGHLCSRLSERNAASQKETSKHEVYGLRLWSNPNLKRYSEWYSTGDKRFPENIELTSLTTKVWFCCDGHLSFGGHTATNGQPGFGVTNEKDRLEFLTTKFENAGFSTRTEKRGIVCIDREKTEQFYDWMGDPLPGFEYKWEYEDYEKYQEKKP